MNWDTLNLGIGMSKTAKSSQDRHSFEDVLGLSETLGFGHLGAIGVLFNRTFTVCTCFSQV